MLENMASRRKWPGARVVLANSQAVENSGRNRLLHFVQMCVDQARPGNIASIHAGKRVVHERVHVYVPFPRNLPHRPERLAKIVAPAREDIRFSQCSRCLTHFQPPREIGSQPAVQFEKPIGFLDDPRVDHGLAVNPGVSVQPFAHFEPVP
jgi:hypothetical protein